MDFNAIRFNYLLSRNAAKQCSRTELDELYALITIAQDEQLYGGYDDIYNSINQDINIEGVDWDIMFNRVISKKHIRHAHRIHFLRTTWFKYAAAILIVAGFCVYFWNSKQKDAPAIVNSTPAATPILPGANKAVLTLSDGRKIELNNNTADTITDGNRSIKNINGQLIYGSLPISSSNRRSFSDGGHSGVGYASRSNILFNTMSTPSGGQYKLTLPDGTRAWLNASSSITFPTAFTKNKREVSITGEVYFEVSKNSKQPFIVKTNTDEIVVLGTSFNINAYADESSIKTSLIEGSVKVNQKIIKPGEAYASGKIIKTNINQDIAWMKGQFNFNDLMLEQAMRQLARWYNIEIKYEKGIPKEQLFGEMDRNLTLQEVLSGLNGVVANFRLEGRTVYVGPL